MERSLSEEKIKLSPLKVCRRFHETGAIINMQWHMHTSKMIPDASSWIIKFPKVPFAHRILRAATMSLMNHCGSVGIYGEDRRDRNEGRWLSWFIRPPNGNCISLEQFESVAGCCGALYRWQEGQRTDVRFAGLARWLHVSYKLQSSPFLIWCQCLKLRFCQHCVLIWTVCSLLL